ncbi:MAG: DUF4198 domain-containing protein [bacterium]|nr:DUF4198 domain-containing protein [bacterium]
MRALFTWLVFLLALATAAGAESLRLERLQGGTHRLSLPAELGESWREINVGRLQVRSASGQKAVDPERLPATGHLNLSLSRTGCSVVQVDVGPAATAGRSDSWQRVTRCTKIAACPEGGRAGAGAAMRQRAGALLTAKTGSRIEIRPLFNPLALEPGSDLPVRLYYQGEAVRGGVISGRGPDGVEIQATADGVGIATLTIPAAGGWTLRFGHAGAVAELIFDVP